MSAATGLDAATAALLGEACAAAGLSARGAAPIRFGENTIVGLSGGIVARIARPGQVPDSAREVLVARWLAEHDVPAVRPVAGVEQPVVVDGRAVTFWWRLPPHEEGTPVQMAVALRELHGLPAPTVFSLPPLAPFTRLADRIDAATTLTPDDRAWLHRHVADLRDRYAALPAGLPPCVVHGDAWVGNVAVTADGVVTWLDLDHVSVGPPEWDLVNTTLRYTSFGWITADTYLDFCRHYGHDLTTWPGFPLLRDIRELRMTCFAAQRAAENPAACDEAAFRVACLRGARGPRPWRWAPTP